MEANRPTAAGLPAGERLLLSVWAVLLVLAIFTQLGNRALFEPDEGRNAEVMREMSATGDFFVPRLNGLLFLDKPFLYYAAGGLAMLALGAGELAARLPGVLCTLTLAVGIGLFARRWWGPRAALAAGLGAAASPLPILYTQIVIFDAVLTLWMCTAVAAFYLAVEGEPANLPGSFRHWSAVAWLAMGLGVLTKGPVALLVPLAAVLPWAIWRRRTRRLVERGAPLWLVAVLVPWVFLVSRADPDFLHYALVTETWSRLTSNELKRDAPVWYYLPVFLFGALPWSLVPLAGWRKVVAAWRARDARIRFLVLWFGVPFVLFSLMHSKRVHYILPLVPALVLLSIWIWEGTPRGERLPGVRAAAAVWSILGLALLGVGLGVGLGAGPKLVTRVEGVPPATVAGVATALGIAWVLGGLFAFHSSRSIVRALCALTLPPMALLLLSAPLATAVGERRSARLLARTIEQEPGAGLEIVAVETFPASLPFYLGRTVVLVSADGDPLRSNYILRRYKQMVRDADPLRAHAWLAGAIADCGTPRLFLLRRKLGEVRAGLALAGRPMREAGRDLVLYGPCAAPPAPPEPAVAAAGKIFR